MIERRLTQLDLAIARRLSGAPRLLASYFSHRNSAARYPRRRLRRLAIMGVLWLLGTVGLWTMHASIRPAIIDLSANRWLVAGVLVIVSSVLVLRRRAALESHRANDWLAALPVNRATKRGENYFYQLLPITRLLATLGIALCTAGMVAAVTGSPVSLHFFFILDVTVGAMLGAGLGLAMPLSQPAVLPPGSRYVPHRRTGTKPLKPSTKALGIWPVRQMFASARPKTVSRAMLFLLLGMPLGSSADVAMLVIGMCALLALLSLLIAAVATVTKAASTWLAPLPLTGSQLARSLLLPSVVFAMAGALLETWLLWLLQIDAARAAVFSLLTVLAVLVLGCISFLTSRRPS